MTSGLTFTQKSVAYVVAVGTVCAVAQAITLKTQPESNPYKEFNQWINSFIIPESWLQHADELFGPYAAHFVVMYLRDLIAGSILYYTVNGLWHLYIYSYKGDKFFPNGQLPTNEVIVDQIMLAQFSLFLYAVLPVFSEWLIEEGYTRAYFSIADIGGWKNYAALTFIYLSLVEIGIYWMHRTLHTNKFLYKYVHALHHKYNKPSMLTPWTSIAFNPLDGILQACPYVIYLFVIPCHYITHVLMIFFTAIWATNIHDALDGNSEPILGSKYHTMHHTHYHVNFGQFFIFCDYFWGTLRNPSIKSNIKDS